MTFASFSFAVVFLPLVVLGTAALFRLGGPRGRVWALLAASVVFYAVSSWQTLPLLLGSLVLNAVVCRKVSGETEPREHRRRWLFAGIVLNVLVLALTKYTRFTLDTVGALVGFDLQIPAYVLPLGISFFTLQQIMYLVDCYEGLANPAPVLDHALLISFFPYVSAGPIVRAGPVLAQLQETAPHVRMDAGVARFIVGLCKKVFLADLCGRLVDPVFGSALPIGFLEGWLAAVAYTLQIYFDFSGYCDMAIGIGWMLGISLPENFDAPLRSSTIVEFWTRWHITLSKFITTYMYTPLLRVRLPATFGKAMAVNIVVMTIVGLWHGPAWTFVVFGLAHGLALVTYHSWRKRKRKLPRLLGVFLLQLFVVLAFVPFRAGSMAEAGSVLAGLVGLNGVGGLNGSLSALTSPDLLISLFAVGLAMAIVARAPSTTTLFADFKPSARWVVGCAILAAWCLLLMNASATSGFIYRDF